MDEYYIYLKWGTLKAWKVPPEIIPLLQQWYDKGVSVSAMLDDRSDSKKKIICDIIDAFDGPIINDWTGEQYNKEDAKNYILTYGE